MLKIAIGPFKCSSSAGILTRVVKDTYKVVSASRYILSSLLFHCRRSEEEASESTCWAVVFLSPTVARTLYEWLHSLENIHSKRGIAESGSGREQGLHFHSRTSVVESQKQPPTCNYSASWSRRFASPSHIDCRRM